MVGWFQGRNSTVEGSGGGKKVMSWWPGNRDKGGAGDKTQSFQTASPVTHLQPGPASYSKSAMKSSVDESADEYSIPKPCL